MKRFLILFTLIAFTVVSCAGPSKGVRPLTKTDYSQTEYDRVWEECNNESTDQDLDSDARYRAYVDCLAKNGYAYQASQETDETKKEHTTKDRLITVGKTAGMVLLGVTLTALYLALMLAPFAPRK